MTNIADSAASAFRALRSTAMGVMRRTQVWTAPTRVFRYAAEIRGRAPAKLHPILDDLFFGAASRTKRAGKAAVESGVETVASVPAKLVTELQDLLLEFTRLYSLTRSSPNGYTQQMLNNLVQAWPTLATKLRAAKVPEEAIAHIDRYLLERLNHHWGRLDDPVGIPSLRVLGDSASAGPVAESLFNKTEQWARQHLRRKSRSTLSLEDAAWDELDAFGKMYRIFPEGDPAWRELADFIALHQTQPAKVQHFIGQLVALRMKSLTDYLQKETQRVIAENAHLVKDGWRVVVQPLDVAKAKISRSVKAGGKLPEQGLNKSGESLDFSVWFVKDDTAMPMVRGQVKSGKEKNAAEGVTQSLESDEWRGLSDFVDLIIDGVPRRLTLRPPDTYTVVKVLVVAAGTPQDAIKRAVPPGGVIDVFELPLSAQEMGMLGGALTKEGAKALKSQ